MKGNFMYNKQKFRLVIKKIPKNVYYLYVGYTSLNKLTNYNILFLFLVFLIKKFVNKYNI